MKTVYKYESYAIGDIITFTLPEGAEILHVNSQGDNAAIQLWALVNPTRPPSQERKIRMAGTGHPLEDADRLRYINTFTMYNKELWFHAFEIMR